MARLEKIPLIKQRPPHYGRKSELICLHGGLRLCRLAGAAAPFVRDIESGRGDIKDKKCQSSYAVKSSIHAVGVKKIIIFPIHEVKHF